MRRRSYHGGRGRRAPGRRSSSVGRTRRRRPAPRAAAARRRPGTRPRHAVLLAEPLAEVEELAPVGAERERAVRRARGDGLAADGAGKARADLVPRLRAAGQSDRWAAAAAPRRAAERAPPRAAPGRRCPANTVREPPLHVDEDRPRIARGCRNASPTAPSSSTSDRVVDPELLRAAAISSCVPESSATPRNSRHLAACARVHRGEVRDLRLARRAPGRPEVHRDDPPAQRRQPHLAPVSVGSAKSGATAPGVSGRGAPQPDVASGGRDRDAATSRSRIDLGLMDGEYPHAREGFERRPLFHAS